MAPITRSSAPSTPVRPRMSTSGLATPPSSGRRPPHCKQCGRPRVGHPRSGCPYVDASNLPSPSSKPTSGAMPPGDDGISEELSSLHIVSPSAEIRNRDLLRDGRTLKRRLSVRFALVPEQTLASLGPTDSELVEQLFQPGIMSNNVSPQDRTAHVLQWRKTLPDAEPVEHPKLEERADIKMEQESESSATTTTSSSSNSHRAAPPLSRRMPCTLFTPTPTASLTPTELVSDQGLGGSAVNMNDTVYLLPDYEVKRTRPMSRSMSFEQRCSFIEQLTRSSGVAPATLLSLPLTDLDTVRTEAEKIGFIVRVLPDQEQDRTWVILGLDEEAINLLAEKFRSEEQKRKRVQGRGVNGRLTAVAGGVVFGAVATWTGLAFS